MIVFELICDHHHRFEGWFASSEGFDTQREDGLLSCPSCGSNSVDKLLTAKIGHAVESRQIQVEAHKAPTLANMSGFAGLNLSDLIDHVLLNTEDVGPEFASEARRIHADEAPSRGIRGQATREETEQLLDEGIKVYSLPVPPKSGWN